MTHSLRVPAMAAVALCLSALASGQTVRTIPFAPITITEPGTYQLTRDIVSSGPETMINVTASGVVIDLNGFQIVGPGNNTGIGVQVDGARNVTVKNGVIANMGVGVRVAGSNNVTVHGLQISARDLAVAPPPETGVMVVQSTGVVIEGNSIFGTGLGIFMRGGRTRGNRVSNNTITAGVNGVFGICYNPTPTDPASPRYDLIEGNVVTGFNVGISFAPMSGPSVVRGNTLFTRGEGLETNGVAISESGNSLIRIR